MNSAPGTMPSILLVEDDRISATFLSAALATLPARVHVAEDCAQALAASGPFDAWLIDANLPDGSGTWLLQHLRETDAAASALAHTADATAATRDALLRAGFAEVLVKLFDADYSYPPLTAPLKPGGLLLLAGILETRADWVVDAARRHGCTLIDRREEGDWVALVVRKE